LPHPKFFEDWERNFEVPVPLLPTLGMGRGFDLVFGNGIKASLAARKTNRFYVTVAEVTCENCPDEEE
jgi:hypothetical protein